MSNHVITCPHCNAEIPLNVSTMPVNESGRLTPTRSDPPRPKEDTGRPERSRTCRNCGHFGDERDPGCELNVINAPCFRHSRWIPISKEPLSEVANSYGEDGDIHGTK